MMGLCALCLGLQERQRGRLLAAWETVSLQGEAGCLCQSLQGIGYGALTRNSDLCPGMGVPVMPPYRRWKPVCSVAVSSAGCRGEEKG